MADTLRYRGWASLRRAWPLAALALLLAGGGPAPPAGAQEHAPAADGAHAPAGEHGAAAEGAHGGGEEQSPLAEEHGSWFKPLTDPINRALGFKLVSGYMVTAWVVIGLLVWMAATGTARIRRGEPEAQTPSGLQNFVEMLVEGAYAFAEGIIGPEGRKYAPLLGTFFIFILLNNWIAVVPGFVAPTSTLNMTLALGFTAFCCVQYFAIRQNGLVGYLMHFAGSPKDAIGWALAPLMFVLEFIGELVKPMSLSMRLFGNIFGEDTVVIQIALFTLGLGGWKILHGHVVEQGAWWTALLPLHLPMMAFSLFGGLIQALVFTMLVSIYISLLTSHHDEDHHHHEEGAEHH